jgi:HK97 family phage portal protein
VLQPLVRTLNRAGAFLVKAAQNLTTVPAYSWLNAWTRWVQEPYAGAWQQNVTVDPQASLLAFSAVFSCITGIAADVGKLRIKLDEDVDGIWNEITANSPWLVVLRTPNHYQNRIKFLEQWILSKLIYGNTYILKKRVDRRGIVTALYPLDPNLVTPLIADNGDVYYELRPDTLSGLPEKVTVPASEIIHDRGVCLFHPLVGVSPIYACGVSATMGNKIQGNSTNLFGNASRPGGVLTAPGKISDETAARLKTAFEANFSGTNVGRLAVLGDGLKFEPMILTAEASQTIEQLRWTVEDVGRCFHYPAWKMGGALPPYSSGPESLTLMYYTDCLQPHVEQVELCLDEGLELPSGQHVELDLENLLRMDTNALYDANGKAVGAGWMSPNEARYRANLAKVTGGESPLIQQQNYSLEALAKRDAKADPFAGTPAGTPAPQPTPQAPMKGINPDIELIAEALLRKELISA